MGKMGQGKSRTALHWPERSLVNLSTEFIESVRAKYGDKPNEVDAVLRDWPICIEARRGRVRELQALLLLGASAKAVSQLDMRSAIELAIQSKCSTSVLALYTYGAPLLEQHALQAAMLMDVGTIRVVTSRVDGCNAQNVAFAILYAGADEEETCRALQAVKYDQAAAEAVIVLCINKGFWYVLGRMVDWFLLMTNGSATMGRDLSRTVLGQLGVMPAVVREKLVPLGVWYNLDLPQLAKRLSYKALVKTMLRMSDALSLQNNVLQKWVLWQTVLDESGMTVVHWMCAQGDAESLAIALANEGSVYSQSQQGNTPLHMVAGLNESTRCIELLLANGADARLANFAGLAPVEMWRRLGRNDWLAFVNDAVEANEASEARECSSPAQLLAIGEAGEAGEAGEGSSPAQLLAIDEANEANEAGEAGEGSSLAQLLAIDEANEAGEAAQGSSPSQLLAIDEAREANEAGEAGEVSSPAQLLAIDEGTQANEGTQGSESTNGGAECRE